MIACKVNFKWISGAVLGMFAITHAQLLVKNSGNTEVMRLTQDGMVAVMSADISGRVSVDKPGNVFSFPGNSGLNTGIAGYHAQFSQITDYSAFNQAIGMGAWLYAGAPSNTGGVYKIDIPVKGALYLNNIDGTNKSIASGYLGMNRGNNNSRDIVGLFGTVDNVDATFSRFADLQNLSAIKAVVNQDGFTSNADKVFALHCSGSKSYIEPPLLIGKDILTSEESEAEMLIYNGTSGKAANLLLKGAGDAQRYSLIFLGRTQDNIGWLINYHVGDQPPYIGNLTFTHYTGTSYLRHLTITPEGYVGINMSNNTVTSYLHVRGLPVYGSNQDAKNGGLTAGAFYRDASGFVRVVF